MLPSSGFRNAVIVGAAMDLNMGVHAGGCALAPVGGKLNRIWHGVALAIMAVCLVEAVVAPGPGELVAEEIMVGTVKLLVVSFKWGLADSVIVVGFLILSFGFV